MVDGNKTEPGPQEWRGEIVYGRLKATIQAGKLTPGQRIRENEMASPG